MARIYYIGDWAIQLGPVYAETSFNHCPKGTEVINYGRWLKAALESGGHHVTSVPTWDFYLLGPGEWERVLADHDIVIFSDVEAKNFQLSPQFFNHRLFGTRVLTFPDRIRLTREAVLDQGKRVMFLGGWLSFNGECGKGGWGRTGLADILPVECLEVEDLRESTEGFCMRVAEEGRSMWGDCDLATAPPILGYNRVRPREGCEVVARWNNRDPAIALGRFGRGATLAYTSDPAPHWGCNLVFWDQYAAFWRQAAAALLAR
jgi:uncharacterized membrane protein